jgi:hypothetical protein
LPHWSAGLLRQAATGDWIMDAFRDNEMERVDPLEENLVRHVAAITGATHGQIRLLMSLIGYDCASLIREANIMVRSERKAVK